ncbi:unnamed protein product, partial [Laminaria digitata]
CSVQSSRVSPRPRVAQQSHCACACAELWPPWSTSRDTVNQHVPLGGLVWVLYSLLWALLAMVVSAIFAMQLVRERSRFVFSSTSSANTKTLRPRCTCCCCSSSFHHKTQATRSF